MGTSKLNRSSHQAVECRLQEVQPVVDEFVVPVLEATQILETRLKSRGCGRGAQPKNADSSEIERGGCNTLTS